MHRYEGASPSNGARVIRSDSTDSTDSGFGDDALSPDEFIQQRLQKLMALGEEEVVTPRPAAPLLPLYGDGGSNSDQETSPSLLPSTMTIYERLQALARAEEELKAQQQQNDSLTKSPNDGGGASSYESGLNDDVGGVGIARSVNGHSDNGSDDEEDSYIILWTGGQMGLLFKASNTDAVVIRRVNKKGAAVGLHYARVGDTLIAVNDKPVVGVPFLDIIEQFKNPTFPMKLEFRPIKPSDSLPPPVPAPLSKASSSSSSIASQSKDSVKDSSETREKKDRADQNRSKLAEIVEEYDVVWDEGPLGCELKQRNGVPTVKSVTGIGVTPSVAQIGAGDILSEINGLKTEEIGFRNTVIMLQRASKPVFLRFQRTRTAADITATPRPAPAGLAGMNVPGTSGVNMMENLRESRMDNDVTDGQLAPGQYAVLWADGPLGIQIKTSPATKRVIVSRHTGAGNPTMTEQISPGDIFVRIAGIDVDALGIKGAFELLKTVQKPVVLVFERTTKSSKSSVPSFRQLREESDPDAYRSPPRDLQSGISRSHSASQGEMKQQGKTSPKFAATYSDPRFSSMNDVDKVVLPSQPREDVDGKSETTSQHSNDKSDHGYSSPPPNYNAKHFTPPPPPFESIQGNPPPRFSEIESGFIPTASLSSLPPPPSYVDIFTQSGRAKVPIRPASPGSDENLSISSGQYEQHGTIPLLPPQPAAFYGSAPLPPPPQYSPHYGLENFPQTRLQEMRQQYIESERLRNQSPPAINRDSNQTMFSTYSDIDDSGLVMPRYNRPTPNRVARGPNGDSGGKLPPPELWVRWSEGPLGITFKRKNGQVVVSRLTGAGYSHGLEQLRPGDWLISFNGIATRNLKLAETMDLLKRLPKPVDMCFVVQ